MHLHAELRRDAARAGFELGWLSVAGVAAALALGAPARHGTAVLALIAAAGLANGLVVLLWRRLPARESWLADAWTGGLVAFATLLVVVAGAQGGWDLLWFVIAPFVAVAHHGRRRAAWLLALAAGFALGMALAATPLSLGEVVLRAGLLAAEALLAIRLAAVVRRAAEARAAATARAELEEALLAEAHHRVKNSLQTIADLLLLGRADAEAGGEAFDRTAERIRSIAAVHALLATGGGQAVAADVLLRAVVDAAPEAGEVTIDAEPVTLPAAEAQQLAIAVNELVTNARRHGRPPVRVALATVGDGLELTVSDAGGALVGAGGAAVAAGHGLGLRLVERIAEHGLHGSFALVQHDDGTVATVRTAPR